MPLRRLESDAEDRCRYEISRRNHSPLHRFASLALKSRITARWRAFPGKNLQCVPKFGPETPNDRGRRAISLRQRKLESDASDRSRDGRSRRNYSSLPLESDAEDRCRYEISRRNHSPLHRFASLGLKSRIDARMRAKTGKTLHRFPSLTPEIKNRCSTGAIPEAYLAVIAIFTP